MTHAALKFGILEGDDIGHEVVPSAIEVARAAAARHRLAVDWRPMPIGRRALDTHGSTMPEGTLEALSQLDGWVLGPIGHRAYPRGLGAINPHPILRKHFNLFANVRPTRSYPGIGYLHDGVDLVIVRENNEGFQPDRNVVAGSGEFRMFVEECRCAAEAYPDVEVDDVIVDTFAMRLVRDPQAFDVVVTTNMFGDILSDEAAGLVGGLGMAPGLCIGEGRVAVAQATHGSAPDIAGQGLANPYAMIESTRMLFDWLGRDRGVTQAVAAAVSMERATTQALTNPASRTADIRGHGRTADMTRAVIRAIQEEDSHAHA